MPTSVPVRGPVAQRCNPSRAEPGLRTTGQVEGEFVLGSSKWTRILLNNKEAFVHSALVSRSTVINLSAANSHDCLTVSQPCAQCQPEPDDHHLLRDRVSPRQRAQLPAHDLQCGHQLRARRGGQRAAARLRRFSQRQFELAGGEAQQRGGLHPRAPALPDPATTSASTNLRSLHNSTTTTSSTGSGQRACSTHC